MINFIKIIGLASFVIFYLISCSSSEKIQVTEQTHDNEKDTVYVFDEIPPEDTFVFESPVQQPIEIYIVQIGAFSNLERAKEFAEYSRAILKKDIKVEFNEQKNLYVVWIHPPFEDKNFADNYRNELKKYKEFKDAWIVTLESIK